jgi:hypothetical protein
MQRGAAACFECALDHIGEVVARLSCDEYDSDAARFTVVFRLDSCGTACSSDAGPSAAAQ